MFKLSQALRSTVSSTMIVLVASLSLAPTTWASDAVSENPTVVSVERLETTIAYENQFKTVGDLISELAMMGRLTSPEKKGIETFLESRHISLEAQIVPGKLSGHSVNWGSMALTWMDNGNVKTQDGRILHANASDSKDKIFIDTFNAMTSQNISMNWSRLLLPSANAAQPPSPLDILGAVLGGITRAVATAFAVNVALPICGVAMGADYLIYKIREALSHGEITCVNGRYAMKGYEDFRHQFGQDIMHGAQTLPHDAITFSKDLDLATYAICAGGIGHAITGTYNSRVQYHEMDPKLASSIFRGPPPVCTPQTAAYAMKVMREHERAVERALVARSAPRPPRNVPNSNSYNPMVQ
jgi:hypothetical protein